MHDCRKIEESLIDLVFNELAEDRRRQTLAQVESCPRCLAQYQAYQATLSTFDEVADLMAPGLGEDYWAGYEARLRVKLAADVGVNRGWQFAEAIRTFLRRPALGFSFASLVLLALTSLYVFRISPALPGNSPRLAAETIAAAVPLIKKKTPVNIAQPSPAVETRPRAEHQVIARAVKSGPKERQRVTTESAITEGQPSLIASVVDAETRRHIEKTQMLLRGFRNLRPFEDDAIGEIADEKRRSRALLFQNILLRREAETRGVLPLQQVLNEVEPLLIDIANLPDKATPDEIRAVRERVQKKEIVATLQGYLAVVGGQWSVVSDR